MVVELPLRGSLRADGGLVETDLGVYGEVLETCFSKYGGLEGEYGLPKPSSSIKPVFRLLPATSVTNSVARL